MFLISYLVHGVLRRILGFCGPKLQKFSAYVMPSLICNTRWAKFVFLHIIFNFHSFKPNFELNKLCCTFFLISRHLKQYILWAPITQYTFKCFKFHDINSLLINILWQQALNRRDIDADNKKLGLLMYCWIKLEYRFWV